MRRIWKHRARSHLFVAAALAAGFALVGAGQAGADATVIVDCAANPNALVTALASPSLTDGTTLVITGSCTGNFEVTHSLTLAGSGGATLDAQGAGTVLRVDAGQTVDISHLTITGGHDSSADGSLAVGAIENFGTLTLVHSSVTGNVASALGAAVGGIVNIGGTLTLTNSTVSGNNASGAAAFGGIRNGLDAPLRITNSRVNGNSASGGFVVGGIANDGPFTLTNSSVSGNSATSGAGFPRAATGGIATGSATLTLRNSTVSGNEVNATSIAAGGIAKFSGTVTLRNSAVVNNTPPNCDFSDPACA